MFSSADNDDLCDARALSQRLRIQCRDSGNAFQTLAVDLRKLRNVLKEIEEATPEASHEILCAQLPRCKAILLGLDLTLQSDHGQEQQSLQPQSVLAAKASVQILTNCLAYAFDNTTTRPRHEIDLTQNMPAGSGVARRSTQITASSDDAKSIHRNSAATNATSSTHSSANIVGLRSDQLPKTSGISLQAIVDRKRALKPITHRDEPSIKADMSSIDCRLPFASSGSYLSNRPQACELSIERFIKPPPTIPRITIEDTRKLDPGDRAAFRWLADTYTLLGRPREALLAYCLAGSCCRSASSPGSNNSGRCLLAERKLLRHTGSNAALESVWADDSFRTRRAVDGQLLHSTVVSQEVAQACFQACSAGAEEDCEVHNRTPSPSLKTRPGRSEWYQKCISPLHIEPGQVWPMAQDITFSTTNVTRGRICPRETDLLQAVQQHPETLLPRKCFSPPITRTITGEGLTHLIPALRETLQTLSMGWSEVLNPRDIASMVVYTAIEDSITTVNCFKLEFVRIPFSTGYGLTLCSSKIINSARKTSELSRIGRKLAAAATKRALKTCLRTTLSAVRARRRAAAAVSGSSKLLPPFPLLIDLPVQPLPLPILPAPAPAPAPTPPPPSSSSSSSTNPTTAATKTKTKTNPSLPSPSSPLPRLAHSKVKQQQLRRVPTFRNSGRHPGGSTATAATAFPSSAEQAEGHPLQPLQLVKVRSFV